jgi:hypothetical protein
MQMNGILDSKNKKIIIRVKMLTNLIRKTFRPHRSYDITQFVLCKNQKKIDQKSLQFQSEFFLESFSPFKIDKN